MIQTPTEEELRQEVISKIEEKTGRRFTMEEYRRLDSKTIGRMLGIDKMSIKTGRDGSGLVVCLETTRYERALTTSLIKK